MTSAAATRGPAVNGERAAAGEQPEREQPPASDGGEEVHELVST